MVRLYVGDVRQFAADYERIVGIPEIVERLKKLKRMLRSKPLYQNYVDKILFWIDKGLISAEPSLLDTIVKDFASITIDTSLKFKKKKFYEHILSAMGYNKARSLYRPYVPQMGIKTCLYCNAQYAITFYSKSNKEYAQFEVDHWMAKDIFPFLSISFFNFVPSCSSCNKHKGDAPLEFNMYSDVPRIIAGDEYDPFVFVVPDYNLSLFLNTNNSDVIKLEFKSRNGDSKMENDYKRFAINEMYELFKDEVALSIKRFLFYSDAFRKQMKSSYDSLFIDSQAYEEFIYGISFRTGEALKRPLAKMTRDIRAQLEHSQVYWNWMKSKGLV